jgi:hypothetical protein
MNEFVLDEGKGPSRPKLREHCCGMKNWKDLSSRKMFFQNKTSKTITARARQREFYGTHPFGARARGAGATVRLCPLPFLFVSIRYYNHMK